MTLPPQNRTYLLAEWAEIRESALAETQRKEAEILERSRSHRSHRLPRSIDYAQVIREWFEAMPPASRQRRFTLEEICIRFKGMYKDRPAFRVIAAAMRRLGWTEGRDWTNAGRNRRYWVPPATPVNLEAK
jgi:hypothetical protein